jgi:hypothetical protein
MAGCPLQWLSEGVQRRRIRYNEHGAAQQKLQGLIVARTLR